MATTAKIKGLTIELGADSTGIVKSMKDIEASSKNTNKELRGINALLKLDPSNVDLLKQKQDLLKKSIVETEEKLKVLQKAQNDFNKGDLDLTEEEYRDLQREIVATEVKLKKLSEENKVFANSHSVALQSASAKTEEFGNKTVELGNKFKGMSMVAGTALAASTAAAISFEDAFTGVLKTVDGTEEQFAKIEQGILDLSQATASSAVEIAAVAESAGQLGIATENILEFTEVMVKLGDTTNLSSEEAASSLAKFANITKMSANDYSNLGSVIVALGNNFATTEADIVAMATRLAATGELTGLTEPQIMGLATTLSSLGIEAEAGGTAMSKLLKEIQLAVELGGDGLLQFAKVANMTGEEFTKAFKEDATVALTAFVSGLNDTERNGKSAIAILNDMGLTEVRLSNAILSMSSNSNLMTKAVQTSNEAWKDNTALTKEAELRYGTTQSKLKQFQASTVELGITLGKVLLPLLTSLVNGLKGLMNWLSSLDPRISTLIVGLLATATAVAPLIILIGKLSLGISSILDLMAKASSFNAVTLTNPWILGITGVIAVTGLLVAAMGNINSEHRNTINAIQEETDARMKLVEQQQKNAESIVQEYAGYESLKKELDSYIDQNGQIKAGYEERARVILNELNKALGTEITLTDIAKNGYKDLGNEVDILIGKKKAMALLDTRTEAYEQAMSKRQAAIKETTRLEKEYSDTKLVNDKKIEELEKQIASTSNGLSESKKAGLRNEVTALQLATSDKKIEYDKQKKELQELELTISTYSTAERLVAENTAESIKKANEVLTASYVEGTKTIRFTLEEQVANARTHSYSLVEIWKKTGDENDLQNAKNAVNTERALVESLANQLGTVIAWQDPITQEWINLGNAQVAAVTVGEAMHIAGANNIKSIADGLLKNNGLVKIESDKIGQTIKAGATVDSWTIGSQTNSGIASGIRGSMGILGSAISEVTNYMIGSYKRGLEIKSPSRVFRRESRFVSKGAALGVLDGEDEAVKSVERLSKNMEDAFSVDLMTNASLKTSSFGRQQKIVLPDVKINDSSTVEKLDKLISIMSQMDIRLEDGTLVGKLLPKIDEGLAIRKMIAERG